MEPSTSIDTIMSSLRKNCLLPGATIERMHNSPALINDPLFASNEQHERCCAERRTSREGSRVGCYYCPRVTDGRLATASDFSQTEVRCGMPKTIELVGCPNSKIFYNALGRQGGERAHDA